MKRLTAVILVCMLTAIFCVGCGGKYKTDGCFVYEVMTYKNGKELDKADYYVRIRELSEYGKQQKYIIVPKEIQGYPVKEIGYTMLGYSHGDWESEVLEKVYFQSTYIIHNYDFLNYCTKLEKMFFIYNNSMNLQYDKIQYYPSAHSLSNVLNKSNISFRFNYINAENEGFYWIDDLDNEKIEVIPEEPKREGYTFGGWYKEPECVSEWDFDTDIVPAKEYDENGEYIYRETCLYAKWVAE